MPRYFFDVIDGHRLPDPAGLTPHEQLLAVRARARQMTTDQYDCFQNQLEPGLEQAGIEPVLRLYQRHSPTLLFVTLGLTALIPLLLGRETFTYYYARRQFPRWQLRVPEFHDVSRVMTGAAS